jgi:hypothetical protein
MIAVCEPHSVPVAYTSWDHWRTDRRDTALFDEPLPLVPRDTSFRASCWGQGRVWRAARNGEGLVPCRCGTCGGEGVVRPA